MGLLIGLLVENLAVINLYVRVRFRNEPRRVVWLSPMVLLPWIRTLIEGVRDRIAVFGRHEETPAGIKKRGRTPEKQRWLFLYEEGCEIWRVPEEPCSQHGWVCFRWV